MAIRTRIEPIDRSIVLAIKEGESPQERGRALASHARAALADAQAHNQRVTGSVPPHDTFVDGRKDAPLESAKRIIVFEFEILSDMFGWIDLQLITHSPVRRGRYQRSHLLLADGIEVDPAARVLPDAEEFVYINAQPYARKIERGLSRQAPDGVYEAVAVMAARRFGNLARIRFGFRSLRGGAVSDWAATSQMRSASPARNKAGARRTDWLTRQPAIIITR